MPAVQKASLTSGAREGPASKSVSALATWSFLLVHEGTRLPCLRTFIWLNDPTRISTRLTAPDFRALFKCPPFNNPAQVVGVKCQFDGIWES